MKKMILTVVALMSMTMTFAENTNTTSQNALEAYRMDVNMNKLSKTLALSYDQVDAVSEVHKTFSTEMMLAAQYAGKEREAHVNKAVQRDLAYLRHILNDDQYRKYVQLLNLTFQNRGLK